MPVSLWCALEKTPRHFNVVVLALESVRASVFWPSPGAPPAPQLEALRQSSVVFTRAYAHEPFTIKALEALLFGIYPSPFWHSIAADWKEIPLESVSERWQRLGLRNAFFHYDGAGPIGETTFLESHGFDEVGGIETLRQFDRVPNDHTLVKALDHFLGEREGQPFAAILWPYQTHVPYQKPAPYPNAHRPNTFEAYRDAVEEMDSVLGELVATLDRHHARENTVIVLVGDHGESFRDHPDGGMGHGDFLYEESTHVPLVMINPRLFHGEQDDRLVQQKDLPGTLAWLAGWHDPDLNHGRNLFFDHPSRTVYLMNQFDELRFHAGVIHGDLKYLYTAPSGELPEDDRLYDLKADPKEQHNLWRERNREGAELRQRLFGWLDLYTHRWMMIHTDQAGLDRAALDRRLDLVDR